MRQQHLTTQVDRCSLKFLTQPAAAAVDTKITSVAANPAGDPIRVQLLDGAGNPAKQADIEVDLVIASGGDDAILGGDFTDSTNSNGVADVRTEDRSAGSRLPAPGVVLVVRHRGLEPVQRVRHHRCRGRVLGHLRGKPTQEGDTTASVTAVSNGILSYSLGLDNLDCNNAVNQSYKASPRS